MRAPRSDPIVQRGWRIDRIPGRTARPVETDHIAVPLWLVKNGEHVADLELTMSRAEAEQLHAELGDVLRVLSGGSAEGGVTV